MSSWDTAFDSNGGSGGSSNKQDFAKFPEGITIIRVIGNAPHTRWTHWMPQFKRSVNCPGNRVCPICALIKAAKDAKQTPKYNTQKKFAINIINRATKRVEIMDQGKTFFEDLRDLRDDGTAKSNLKLHGELHEYDVRVKRRGTGQDDTTYRLDFEEKYELTPEDADLVATAVDLDEYFRPHPPEAIKRVLAGEAFDEVMKDVFGTQEESASDSTREEYTVE
jgi:hypothetical protein